jgi:hypothetical protein
MYLPGRWTLVARSREQVAELAERLAGRLGRVGLDLAADEPAAGPPAR